VNVLTKRNFLAAVRSGNPADVAFYSRAFDENKQYPFEGEASTYLARAVWALRKSGMKVEEMMADMKCDYDCMAVGRYCKENKITTKALAERIGIKPGVLALIRCGSYPAGKMVDRVMDWIADTAPGSGLPPTSAPNCKSIVVPVENILDQLKNDPSVYDIQITFKVKK